MKSSSSFYLFAFVSLLSALGHAAEYPRGFFVEDLSRNPPVPAFYNIDSRKVEPFTFREPYTQFIDVIWDRDHKRVFFSARRTPKDPYRVYLKAWPKGEEKVVYENPLGPFRFILSPDSRALVFQVMGPSAWPILAVHEWENSKTTLLGPGFSPDWSPDGQRVLFLQIPGSLPSWLTEYDVATGTSTVILDEPVAEAVYSDSPDRIILKKLKQSKTCDEFQLWDRRRGTFKPFSATRGTKKSKRCISQRDVNAFPGHQFLYFKESETATNFTEQTLVVTDSDGSRLQVLPNEKWNPKVTSVESATLVIGEDPLYVMSADGAGGTVEVGKARFIKFQR